MEVSITVTTACNLKCKYCYQGNHEGNLQISDTSIEKMCTFIKNKMKDYNDSSLHVVFIGGEPLLAYKKIYKIIDLLESSLPKVNRKFYITTNGTILNDKIFSLLYKKGIEVSVSIDGNKESHDKNRIDIHNKGTYEKVILGINKLHENGINVIARMTVSPDGVYTFYDDVVNLYSKGIDRINPVCDFTCEWSDMQVEELKIAYKKLATWYLTMEGKVSLTCFDGRFYSLLTRKQCFCNAGSGPHYTISTSGNIYPCNYVTDNPEFNIGNLEQIKTHSDIRNLYLQHLSNIEKKCYKCEVTDFCYGRKCLFLNWKTSGYLNVSPAILCKHEKFLYYLLQELLLALCETKPNDIANLIQYIQNNKIGNETFDKLEGVLWNMT